MPALPSEPPRCIKPFGYARVQTSVAGLPSGVNFNCFKLICRCGHDIWRVHGYWLGNRDGFIGPLAIRCAKCGELQELIDTDKDGHDAEIGDSSLERRSGARSEWECNSCNSSSGRLIASFGYQFEPDDEVARRPQDYFDTFILTHICLDNGNAVEVAMFDCA